MTFEDLKQHVESQPWFNKRNTTAYKPRLTKEGLEDYKRLTGKDYVPNEADLEDYPHLFGGQSEKQSL